MACSRSRTVPLALGFPGWLILALPGLQGAAPLAPQDAKTSEKKAAPEEAPGLEVLVKDLKAALAGPQPAVARAVLDQLAGAKSVEAYKLIIDNALVGTSHAAELYAVDLLVAAARADPGARALVLDSIDFKKNPQFKVRLCLVSVAEALPEDAAARKAIHGALKDPHRGVVLAALSAERKLKNLEAVEPLIEVLAVRESKPQDRVYNDVLKLLKDLTGAELKVAVDWKNYWEARKSGQAPPKKATPGKGKTVVWQPPKFFQVEVASDRVLFVIDVSGSMTERDPLEEVAQGPNTREDDPKRGKTEVAKKPKPKPKAEEEKKSVPASRERLSRVKNELARAVNGLPQTTRFGILAFSHELSWWGGANALKEATAANKSDATSWVRALVANGATRTDLALKDAFSLPDIDTIYLLTDGAPKDESDQRLAIDPILAYVRSVNRFVRCRINTISFWQIKDRDMKRFVRELAFQNDGEAILLK